MAQSAVNFRLDSDVKKDLETVCESMGMTMTTAFTIFAKAVVRENRIPFDVVGDPFYSEKHLARLRKLSDAIDSGEEKLVEHDIIED